MRYTRPKLQYTWPMLSYIRPMLRYIRPMLSYITPMLSYIRPHKALVEAHRTLGTYRNPRKSSHVKVQRLCKQQYIILVLLDLLSVAVLIHTVEGDGALVVLAVGLDKLCTQQIEVHKAQIEVLFFGFGEPT